jgi:geranylgeranyl pyrophosphate synthase
VNGPDATEDLATSLKSERRRVEAALDRALDVLLPLLPHPLRAPIRHGVLTGGKRLRPVLCVTAYRACGGDGRGPPIPGGGGDGRTGGDPGEGGDGRGGSDPHEALYDMAASLELIHAYSLMHDDLPCMDDAPLRRGRATPHTVFGERVVALGGSLLIPAAGLRLLRGAGVLGVGDARRRELLRILARAAGAGGMVGGQGLDLEGEGRSLPREELDGLHRRKTGALLEASLELGAVAAGAHAPTREALARYGRAVGLSFQIADDILDATSSSAALGKAPSDQDLAKSTYVGLLGVKGARTRARDQVHEALSAIRGVGLQPPAAATLEALARYVVERDR